VLIVGHETHPRLTLSPPRLSQLARQ
jgi:hypothetical protein